MNFNIYLKNTKSQNTHLNFVVSYRGGRVKRTSGISVTTKYWDKKKQQVKSNHPDFIKINEIIQTKFQTFKDNFFDLIKQYPYSDLKEIVLIYDNSSNSNKLSEHSYDDFIKLFELYTNYLKNFKSNSSYKNLGVVINDLKELNNTFSLSINRINNDFIENYTAQQIIKNNTNDTIKKKIKQVFSALNYGYKNKYHNYNGHKECKNIYSDTDEPDTFALEPDEIQKIINLKLNHNYLEDARDLVIFAAFTGQRYSDYLNNLKPENFQNNNNQLVWKMRQQKTNRETTIPLPKITTDIVYKHNKNIKVISNQKINKYLKELCKLAKIDYDVCKTKKIGSKQISVVYPKYELISFHSLRRTYVSISNILQINSLYTKKITNIRNEKTYNKYLKMPHNVINDVVNNFDDYFSNIDKNN